MALRLPPELTDQIIDILGDTYRAQHANNRYRDHSAANRHYSLLFPRSEPWRSTLQNLCAASLANRAFRDRAQFHMFTVIRLFLCVPGLHAQDNTSARHRARMQGLLNALQTRDSLAGARIYLSIFHKEVDTDGLDPTADVDMMNLMRHIRTSTVCITTLNLTAITAHSITDEFITQDVHPTFIDHFLDMKHVTRLELRGYGLVPWSLFALCPRLTALVIDGAKIDWAVQGTDIQHCKSLQILQLTIGKSTDSRYFSRFLKIGTGDRPLLDLTNLDSLTIRVQAGERRMDFEEIQCNTLLAKLCGATLGRLYVDLGLMGGIVTPSLCLTNFTCLRTLSVRVNWLNASIDHFCSWLSQLPPSSALSEVNLDIIIQTPVPVMIGDNWELLDQTVGDLFRSSRSGVKTVTICFYTYHLPDRAFSEVPAEYLEYEALRIVRWTPLLYAEIEKRASHYIFQVAIAPKFLKLFGSTDIKFRVTLGGEVPYWWTEI